MKLYLNKIQSRNILFLFLLDEYMNEALSPQTWKITKYNKIIIIVTQKNKYLGSQYNYLTLVKWLCGWILMSGGRGFMRRRQFAVKEEHYRIKRKLQRTKECRRVADDSRETRGSHNTNATRKFNWTSLNSRRSNGKSEAKENLEWESDMKKKEECVTWGWSMWRVCWSGESVMRGRRNGLWVEEE